mgnify:CR=1 FL=1
MILGSCNDSNNSRINRLFCMNVVPVYTCSFYLFALKTLFLNHLEVHRKNEPASHHDFFVYVNAVLRTFYSRSIAIPSATAFVMGINHDY